MNTLMNPFMRTMTFMLLRECAQLGMAGDKYTTSGGAAFERSVAQARTMFGGVVEIASQAFSDRQRDRQVARTQTNRLLCKILAFSDQNLTAFVELSEKLGQAKDPIQIMGLQRDYFVLRMQALANQSQELSGLWRDALRAADRGTFLSEES